MRRTIVLLTTMAMMLLVATSVAMAATISCQVPTHDGFLCQGTSSDDTMTGTDATYGNCADPDGCWGDNIFGYGGNDTLIARGGPDQLNGGLGNDKLDGGGSFDRLMGNSGDDVLSGGAGKDSLYGNSGNDRINAADKEADSRISCGDGYDTVRYDRYLDVPDGDCEAKTGVVYH